MAFCSTSISLRLAATSWRPAMPCASSGAGAGAAEVADAATGLAHQQHAGGDVPGLHPGLEVAVGAAAGHVGQVERGGTGAADVLGLDAAARARIPGARGARSRSRGGKPVISIAPGQVLALADADALVVEHRAAAAAGGEQLVAQRVEDRRRAAVRRSRPGRSTRTSAGSRAGSCWCRRAGRSRRWHCPCPAAPPSSPRTATVRIGAAQFLDHRLLGLVVHLAGVIHAVLLDHVDRVELVHAAQEDVAGRRGPP